MTGSERVGGGAETGAGRVPRSVLFLALGLDVGGVARQMMLLGGGLRQRGARVTIAAPRDDAGRPFGVERYRSAGFETRVVPVPAMSPRLSTALGWRRGVRALRGLLDETEADVVHCHAPTLVPVARSAAGAGAGRAVVASFHIEQIGRVKRAVARAINAGARGFAPHAAIAVSPSLRDRLVREFGYPAAQTVCVPALIDTDRFRPASAGERARVRAELGVAPEDFVVCQVGLLDPRKNQQALIEAIGRLRRDGRAVRAVLVGDGSAAERARLGAIAQPAGDAVLFTGFRADPEWAYSAADLCVLPSSAEGFGMVVVEANLCGVPHARTPTAGHELTTIPGRTGVLLDDPSPGSIARCIGRLMDDREELAAMAAVCEGEARGRFGVGPGVDATLAVYRGAMVRAGACS